MDGGGAHAGAVLIEGLRRLSCYDHACGTIEVVETHLSWVILTGPVAYKVKKPVNLGFADFSTLERRHRFCELELRLNRRLAPELYVDVVSITGSPEAPRIGGAGPVVEYAVRMVQFPQEQLAACQLGRRHLTGRHVDRLAADVAEFHARTPWAGPASGRGDPAAVHEAVRQNFATLRELPEAAAWRRRTDALERWSEARYAAVAGALQQRHRSGCVRECHGDLHLGNLVMRDGRLVPFDGIEFSPALRWIDTASDIAFTVMDLRHRHAPALAHRFLNAYLEASGDYGALAVLDYFLVYRALVRAKVAAIRAGQCLPGSAERAATVAESREYVLLAARLARPRRGLLVITHGVAGTGKTVLSKTLVERLGLIRVRSDVERKRLFGLRQQVRPGDGLYEAAITERTYGVLAERAEAILRAGYGVAADATFLHRAQRERFAALAQRHGCPFRIVALTGSPAVLRERVAARLAGGADASDATAAVLDAQLAQREPPSGDERRHTIFDPASPAAVATRLRAIALELPQAHAPTAPRRMLPRLPFQPGAHP